ncbi:MAG: bifunctional hydroxymethylpyrimidine kinase/phosphomethylpyrimidine kinase [Acidobacteria bacterium]|nr:bifunctional hydroxymethylpyrimidine kinase/phosphomethylpyrimidine kinase [Acidobacteriota bacterium]
MTLRPSTIAVIGDLMLDHFVIGRVDRISPEAPVPVVRFERDEFRLGGAANVAANVRALDGVPLVVGCVGADETARTFRQLLLERTISDSRLVADGSRPTTRKVRVVTTRNQQVARVDYEDESPLSGVVAAQLAEAVRTACADAAAIVLSDYRKGVVTPAVIAAAREAAGTTPIVVDPKVPDASRYAGVTVLTPNHHEAELMTGTRIHTADDCRAAARALHAATGANVLITWGEHGMWVFDASGASAIDLHIPATAREVADVTGAGDTVVATLALALANGASLSDAARLANRAAGIVVGRFGASTVTLRELDQ